MKTIQVKLARLNNWEITVVIWLNTISSFDIIMDAVYRSRWKKSINAFWQEWIFKYTSVGILTKFYRAFLGWWQDNLYFYLVTFWALFRWMRLGILAYDIRDKKGYLVYFLWPPRILGRIYKRTIYYYKRYRIRWFLGKLRFIRIFIGLFW